MAELGIHFLLYVAVGFVSAFFFLHFLHFQFFFLTRRFLLFSSPTLSLPLLLTSFLAFAVSLQLTALLPAQQQLLLQQAQLLAAAVQQSQAVHAANQQQTQQQQANQQAALPQQQGQSKSAQEQSAAPVLPPPHQLTLSQPIQLTAQVQPSPHKPRPDLSCSVYLTHH